MAGPFTAINHIGFVVKNLDEGARFFTEVLGFEAVSNRKGELSPSSDTLTRRFGVNAAAHGRFAFFRLGDTSIELLEWSAPNRNETVPINSDMAGRHLAISVTDVDAALAKLKVVEGITIREPNEAGYIYCATPLGLEIQLIPV